jgi:hypothetical protein
MNAPTSEVDLCACLGIKPMLPGIRHLLTLLVRAADTTLAVGLFLKKPGVALEPFLLSSFFFFCSVGR